MQTLVRSALCAVFIVAISAVQAQSGPFHASDFGAVPNDDLDDRAAMQSALDAAEAAGGAPVHLDPGIYDIEVVVARGTGGTSGYHGVAIPPGCALTGAGMDSTTMRFVPPLINNPAAVGNGIINKGYQTAATDYGGGGNISISHLRLETPTVTNGTTGNLMGFAHVDGAVISSVFFGSSRFHGLEVNLSRGVTVEDCVFDGEHRGTSTVQFDIGSIGARSTLPATTVIRDVLFRRCQFKGRGAETAPGKVIELGHSGANCILRNIAFEDCFIESLTPGSSTCVSNDNPPAKEMTGLRFERCHFKGIQEQAASFGLLSIISVSTALDDIAVRGCHFTGAFSHGVILVTASTTFNTGHSLRHGIVIEGNRFAPVLDRTVPTSINSMRMVAVAACTDVTVRRNLIECPATGENLSLINQLTGVLAVNNLDTRIEDNVFTWAHRTPAAAPAGLSKQAGIIAPAYQLEQAGMKARTRITGNVFLYPENGIAGALIMTTSIPTTSWAPNAPWVGGLIAGNYASGAGSSPVWSIHHDLSGAGNVGQVLPSNTSRTAATGWFDCNGSPLTTLDSGNHQLASVNGSRCGCNPYLPMLPGQVIRLHGPLKGEGLLANYLERYAGSSYEGNFDTPDALRTLPVATLVQGTLCVVRDPLTVYRWEAGADPATIPPGALEPADKTQTPVEPGFWIPLDTGLGLLEDDADLDGDGRSNHYERALLSDPTVPESPDTLAMTRFPDGTCMLTFRTVAGPHSPRISLQSSSDLTQWTTESSCAPGGLFEVPETGVLLEMPSFTGREIIRLTTPSARQFWRVVVER